MRRVLGLALFAACEQAAAHEPAERPPPPPGPHRVTVPPAPPPDHSTVPQPSHDPPPLPSPPPPPPPPPLPLPPQIVAPSVLEAQRLTGNKHIVPDAATVDAIRKSGHTRVVSAWKLCVDATGAVQSVTMLKSSGFVDYDATIRGGIGSWQYRPMVVDQVATPVCTAVTFIYTTQ